MPNGGGDQEPALRGGHGRDEETVVGGGGQPSSSSRRPGPWLSPAQSGRPRRESRDAESARKTKSEPMETLGLGGDIYPRPGLSTNTNSCRRNTSRAWLVRFRERERERKRRRRGAMEGSVLVADGLAGVSFGASAEEECRGELDILRALDLPAEEECRGELDILRALDLPAEEECRGELDILRALDLPAEGPESIKMSEAGAGDKVKTAASNDGKAEAGADDEAKAGKKKKKTVRVSKDTINSAMSWPYHGEPRRFLSDELLDRIEDAKYRERLRNCFARAAAAVYDMEEHYKGIREQYIRKGYAEIEVYEREVY